MLLLRTFLLAIAVLLAPQATLAHASADDAPAHVHAMAKSLDMHAADVTDCCDAAAQPGSCSADLSAVVADGAVVTGLPLPVHLPLEGSSGRGIPVPVILDPPRL